MDPVPLTRLPDAVEDGECRGVVVARFQAAAAALRLAARRTIIDVQAVRPRGDVFDVVVLVRVVRLAEVVPLAPAPDLDGLRAPGLDLDDQIVPDLAVGDQLRVPPRRDGLLLRLPLPDEHEDVAVGQRLEVVVAQVLEARQRGPAPDRLVVPGHALDEARRAAGLELRRQRELVAVAEQVAVL